MRRTVPVVLGFVTVVGACQPAPPSDAPAEGPSRADTVAMAMLEFDPAAFDTIEWASDQEAYDRGALVFRISCEKCHGPHGAGDGGFVFRGDTLRPPSFLTPDWALAEAPMQLRRYIFSGNVVGMPYWGLVGLKYRDIDAVARFISGPLRAGVIRP